MEQVAGRFRLPPEQALALAVEDSPDYVACDVVVLGAMFLDLGLGAEMGEARLRKVLMEAGFTHFHRATATPFNLVLEAQK